jgi:hypothetical protein
MDVEEVRTFVKVADAGGTPHPQSRRNGKFGPSFGQLFDANPGIKTAMAA